MNLLPFQERVITEKNELDQKISRLKAFLDPIQLHGITPEEHDRLKRQLALMTYYSKILQERIDHFSPVALPPVEPDPQD